MPEFKKSLAAAVRVFESLATQGSGLSAASALCLNTLKEGGKILLCGNGGSASEAQHLAGELMGRYKHKRAGLPAIALVSDSAVLTCIGNDFCFDEVFARQLHALGRSGDILIAFSTSGNSLNILAALNAARALGIQSIALLGNDGGHAKSLADHVLQVSDSDTARVQEAHMFLMHCLMDEIEAGLTEKPAR